LTKLFSNTHKPIQESFGQAFSKACAFRLRKAIKRRVAFASARKRQNAPVQYVPSVVNIPFPLWRNADVNPRGILGDGTEYITSLILRNVPSVSSLQSFFFVPSLAKEKALKDLREVNRP